MDSQKWNGIALLMHDLWNPQQSIAEEATINFRITTDVFKISQCTRGPPTTIKVFLHNAFEISANPTHRYFR